MPRQLDFCRLLRNDLFVKNLFAPDVNRDPDTGIAAWWFVFCGQKMLLRNNESGVSVPRLRTFSETGLSPLYERSIGELHEGLCFVACVKDDSAAPPGMDFRGLRTIFGMIDADLFGMSLRALSIINWENTHRYCGRCGSPVLRREDILAQQCTICDFTIFPRISPAVIVLVEREGKVLLARASRFKERLYSVIAGFVEPGESLEQTVSREIREEIGIDVKNIRYFGSQPWPFPDSLMVGFTAQYAGGEIVVDGEEIVEAHWFAPDQLPDIPDKISIARALIDWFVAKNQ